ncbi:MAG: glycosyltransferase family 4 protein [Chloroflexota bacterium]
MRVAFISSSVPRRCGIATFTADIMAAVKAADPTVRCSVVAIDEPNNVRAYGAEVKARIRQQQPESYRAAATLLNGSSIDVVNIQHEFGLYGVWKDGVYQDHLRPFLLELRKPAVTTLHSVLPDPSPSIRDAVRTIAEHSDEVVVMAHTAARLLKSDYGITRTPVVIPHGMPAIEPSGRHVLKRRLGMTGRTIVSTFGLVDPRKGLEYVIGAMPSIVVEHPDALYLIVGQTHPELLKQQGEVYRNTLEQAVQELGMSDHVAFVNEYLTQRAIVDYLLATDVYVTPYLDPNQITSGTLAYALGAGKAIVSTPYLHAVEAMADGRGILVPFRDSVAIAGAVRRILGDPQLKQSLEARAYAYGRETAWPAVGRRVLELMQHMVDPTAHPGLVAV